MSDRSRRREGGGPDGSGHGSSGRGQRLLFGAVYWAAVLAASIALVVILLLFFEARDASQLREGATAPLRGVRGAPVAIGISAAEAPGAARPRASTGL